MSISLILMSFGVAAGAQPGSQNRMQNHMQNHMEYGHRGPGGPGQNGMCMKSPMEADGIVRLSRVEVYPEYLDEYIKYATEVGETSLQTEPGVLTMYAMSEKDNPCIITILETYSSQAAYESHIASDHFKKYKEGTAKMVKDLQMIDQTPINSENQLTNFICEPMPTSSDSKESATQL